MPPFDPNQFFGFPSPGAEKADVLILPVPVEKTVCYGTGTADGPRAILDASMQVDSFDEETLLDFTVSPRLHVLPPLSADGDLETCLGRIEEHVRTLRNTKFVLALGGEHSITYGLVRGHVEDLNNLTIVQIDAHPDMADALNGRHWSHGTVMRRLWEQGCRLLQIGIRSLTRSEYDVATASERVTTFYAHQLHDGWSDVLSAIRNLTGDVYLTLDVDGLDPSIIPSTGTPQPNGLTWRQTMDVLRTLMTESKCRLIAADMVEFVPSPVVPGCDPTAARLVTKLLAWWWTGKKDRHST
jgi:agmatinase